MWGVVVLPCAVAFQRGKCGAEEGSVDDSYYWGGVDEEAD